MPETRDGRRAVAPTRSDEVGAAAVAVPERVEEMRKRRGAVRCMVGLVDAFTLPEAPMPWENEELWYGIVQFYPEYV